jgi:hypothetical protein
MRNVQDTLLDTHMRDPNLARFNQKKKKVGYFESARPHYHFFLAWSIPSLI